MPRVNPEILRWAREGAGLSPGAAAAALDVRAARGRSGPERMDDLEAGREDPSRALLVRMAKQYRRPLVAFYLSEPPRAAARGRDFRRLPEEHSRRDDALVDALLRDVRARQSTVRAALEEEDDARPLLFIGSMREADGVDAVLTSIRATLGFSLADFRRCRTPDAAFQYLRDRAEAAGVFVLLAGNLGSHHTAIDVELFRGFALADPVAPFVVVNDQDSAASWSFTLAHELVHLWLGQTGVSGGAPDREVERFCNDAASELLLPAGEIRADDWGSLEEIDALVRAIGGFARERRVSRAMVAYRLYRRGVIGRGEWMELRARFRRQWAQQRESRRLRSQEDGSGPDYYVVKRHRLGRALVEFSARMLASGALSTTEAGHVLGVRPKLVGPLVGASAR